jgi:hypothetical protein
MNWKTTFAGIFAIALQSLAIWAPGVMGNQKVIQTIQVASVGAGLIAAKDSSAK